MHMLWKMDVDFFKAQPGIMFHAKYIIQINFWIKNCCCF